MRTQPPSSLPIPVFGPLQDKNRITEVRDYQLITPLFGGGIEPARPDPVTTIRGTEIRAHLRFWWRACRGGTFKDIEELKKAEDAIWGKAYKKGDTSVARKEVVQVEVKILDPGVSIPTHVVRKNENGKKRPYPTSNIPGYASFPLQPDEIALAQEPTPVQYVRKDISFRLTISFPQKREEKDKLESEIDIEQEIRAALWAWETFGGVGARTRRGFGALCLLKIGDDDNIDRPDSSSDDDVKKWLDKKLASFITSEQFPANLPHLSRKMQCKPVMSYNNPMQTWNNLIKRLEQFRQIPDGRNGRSNWPEAEAIRTITRQRKETYRRLDHPLKFPRAAFGLPIIFHFKKEDQKKGDPPDATLAGTNKERSRMGSPLILRPLICKDKRAVGLALLLEGVKPTQEKFSLSWKNRNGSEQKQEVEAGLTKPETEQILPLKTLNHQTNVLLAFMDYLEKDRGNRE